MAWNSQDDNSRFSLERFVFQASTDDAKAAHTRWMDVWGPKAFEQGWCIFDCDSCFQVQKLDCPDEWEDKAEGPVPEWDNDAIAWGMVYHGTDPVHEATREFLKQYALTEWALIEEACRGNGAEEALHSSTGAADGG